MKTTETTAITPKQYQAFQTAYDFLNKELFAGELPQVLVTLQRKANSRGYFHPENFQGRSEQGIAHELAMNPDAFVGRTDEEIISTLAHEMAHVWQQEHGKPASGGYHNKEWAQKMVAIGLMPSDTGMVGGKQTGPKMTHYILPGEAYAKAFAKLASRGWRLDWQSTPATKEAKAKLASKTKFSCPQCEQNAWGKPDSRLLCGECYELGDIVVMEACS